MPERQPREGEANVGDKGHLHIQPVNPRKATEVVTVAVKDKIPTAKEVVSEPVLEAVHETQGNVTLGVRKSAPELLTTAHIPLIAQSIIKALDEAKATGTAQKASPTHEDLSKQLDQGFRMVRQERIEDVLERKKLQSTIREMGDGPVNFLARLQGKLTRKDSELFLELIGRVQDGVIVRVRTYAEIGKRLGITKQAVQKRYRKLAERVDSAGKYIKIMRNPEKPTKFSEMSPSARRKEGIDESYNYDAG